MNRRPACTGPGCNEKAFTVCAFLVKKRDKSTTECGRHLCRHCAQRQPKTRGVERFFCAAHHRLAGGVP